MRNKRIKTELQNVYQPPKPLHKKEFCEQMRQESGSNQIFYLTTPEFLASQLHYIRPWGWVVSVAVLLASFVLMDMFGEKSGWRISALVPFISSSLIVELHRSVHFRMDELEQATRFSLKAVTFARLFLLGICNLVLLIVLAPFMIGMCKLSPLAAGVYLLAPYLATSFLCLLMLRMWHSKENVIACGGISVGISLLCVSFEQMQRLTASPFFCVSLLFLLLIFVLLEYKKYFATMEELAWN